MVAAGQEKDLQRGPAPRSMCAGQTHSEGVDGVFLKKDQTHSPGVDVFFFLKTSGISFQLIHLHHSWLDGVLLQTGLLSPMRGILNCSL